MRQLILKIENWPIAGAFIISRSTLKNITVVTAEIHENGFVGRGECRPYARYNETPESVIEDIEKHRGAIEADISLEDLQSLMPAGAARNAIDCALWDLKAKKTGQTVSQLLNLPPPKKRITAYTLSMDSPANMRMAALKAKQYPILKIKIGHEGGLEACLAIIKARPDAQLIIDANEALKPDEIEVFRSSLETFPVIMIEQPIAASTYDLIPNTSDKLPIFCADESLHSQEDLEKLWIAGYRAVNIKLDKCGGLTAGLKLIQSAKARGFIIMAGCMVGTSLAMAPMMILESYADYIDLDGPLLLTKDRDDGLRYEGPNIIPAPKGFWG